MGSGLSSGYRGCILKYIHTRIKKVNVPDYQKLKGGELCREHGVYYWNIPAGNLGVTVVMETTPSVPTIFNSSE